MQTFAYTCSKRTYQKTQLLFFCILRFHLQEQETPLHCAAWHGYSAVARALCQAGCHVNAKNREGESALLTASARGFVDIVECLVEHRADLEATDKVISPQHLDSVPLPTLMSCFNDKTKTITRFYCRFYFRKKDESTKSKLGMKS